MEGKLLLVLAHSAAAKETLRRRAELEHRICSVTVSTYGQFSHERDRKRPLKMEHARRHQPKFGTGWTIFDSGEEALGSLMSG